MVIYKAVFTGQLLQKEECAAGAIDRPSAMLTVQQPIGYSVNFTGYCFREIVRRLVLTGSIYKAIESAILNKKKSFNEALLPLNYYHIINPFTNFHNRLLIKNLRATSNL